MKPIPDYLLQLQGKSVDQIETPALLGQIGGCQVDGDAPLREFKLRGLQRGAHAVARLAHFGIGQPYQAESGKAIGQMHLDRDLGRIKADERAAAHERKRHAVLRTGQSASLADNASMTNR